MTFNDIQIRILERGSVFEPFKIADPISEKMDPDLSQFSEMLNCTFFYRFVYNYDNKILGYQFSNILLFCDPNPALEKFRTLDFGMFQFC